jgi:tryptophan synthase beta chain
MRSVAYSQTEVFDAAKIFARTEGMITAPETAHCVKYVIDEALRCKKTGERKIIAFNNCGHGLLDLQAYDAYLNKKLVDYEPANINVPTLVNP